jgi:hypothetical protein
MPGKIKDVSNQPFNELTAIKFIKRDKGSTWWQYKCSCGNFCIKRLSNVSSGNTTSCGCKQANKRCKDKHACWGGYGEIHLTHWNHIQYNARHKNIEFNITIEYAWLIYIQQNRKCALSNLDIHFASNTTQSWCRTTTASLDRIDSSKGYIIGNIQWIHKQVNFMKHSLSTKRFLELCKLITVFNSAKI